LPSATGAVRECARLAARGDEMRSSLLPWPPQLSQRVLEIRRERGGDLLLAAAARGDAGETLRMQQDPRRPEPGAVLQSSRLFRAVGRVACDGEAQMLEMDADLVGPSRVQFGLDERGRLESFPDAVAGPGVAAYARADGHAFAVRRMPSDRRA